MSDWLDKLDDEDRAGWEEFVENFRRDALEKMTGSAFVAQLIPSKEGFDAKFAIEVGAAILLDKPILAIVMSGCEIPEKLRLVADEIVYADLDTESGQKEVALAISRMTQRMKKERRVQ